MPLSKDVTLPRSVIPRFPDKCIVCHCKPDSTTKIAHNSSNWFLAFFIPLLMLFGWSRVEIPICQKCKPRFRLQRWGRELISWGLIIVAVLLIMPYFSGWSGLAKKIVVGALALLAVSPSIIAEVIWPRIFDTTAQNDTMDYEFASEEYAAEFHAINQLHIIESEVDFDADDT